MRSMRSIRSVARLSAVRRAPVQQSVIKRFLATNNGANSVDPKDGKSSDPQQKKKQPDYSSSLLTDDILERAGIDPKEAKRPSKESAEEAAASSETGTSTSQDAFEGESSATSAEDGSEAPKKKWEATARKSSEKSSTDIKREKRSNVFYAVMLGAALGGAAYLARDWDDEEERKRHSSVPSGYSISAMYGRAAARFGDVFNYFNEPIFDKLLPDPLPEPYGRPYTLVVGLDDLLVHSEWSREHGWRTAKRPGVDYFLGYLAQYYEIVVFSSKYQVYSEKTVAKLDPYRSCISYALFREATRYQDGKVIKDLSALNRDLGKIIMLDTDAEAWTLQPDNAIKLKPWKGKPGDQGLVSLIPFLEWIASQPIKDVRPILKSFDGVDDVAVEYARRESIARKKFEEEWYAQHQGASSSNWAAKFLGMKPAVPPTPMMPQDYVRQEGQKGYEAFQKYLAEHGEKMLAEEKEREKELLNEQKFTLNKLVTEGMPNPEELAAMQAEREKEARLSLEKTQIEEQEGIKQIESSSAQR